MIRPQHLKLGLFGNMFGGGGTGAGGGIAHNGNGATMELPRANPQQNNGTANGGNPATPGNGGEPTPQAKAVDPINSQLDELRAVWNTPVTADGKPVAQQVDPLAIPLFQFDPNAVQQSAGKMDFTGGISPELATKAMSGDADAFKEAINSAVRLAFTASTLNTGNLLNDGFSRHGKNIDAALPTRLRNIQIQQNKSSDPILSHPSFQPLVAAMQGIIAKNRPHASPDEVAQMTESYFQTIGGVFAETKSKAEAKANGTVEEEVDWLKQMGLG